MEKLKTLVKWVDNGGNGWEPMLFDEWEPLARENIPKALNLFPKLVQAVLLLEQFRNLPDPTDYDESFWCDLNYDICSANEEHAMWFLTKRDILSRKIDKLLKEIESVE